MDEVGKALIVAVIVVLAVALGFAVGVAMLALTLNVIGQFGFSFANLLGLEVLWTLVALGIRVTVAQVTGNPIWPQR